MSRVGLKPISLPKDVKIDLKGDLLTVKGPKGELRRKIHPRVNILTENDQIVVSIKDGNKGSKALHGLFRALIANMVTGVSMGFERKLELVGIGYRAQQQGDILNLTLGYSHPVKYPIPDGIKIQTPSATQVVVTGIDKQKVGQVAAEIRAFRPPEPYKGKGIKYADEHILRKEAKKK